MITIEPRRVDSSSIYCSPGSERTWSIYIGSKLENFVLTFSMNFFYTSVKKLLNFSDKKVSLTYIVDN